MLTPRIKWRDPVGLGSADAPVVCRCDDDQEYVVKGPIPHPQTPHDEWFCTQLAGLVGIACPPCSPVEDETGELLFGSRWEGGLAPAPWLDMVVRGEIPKAVIAGPLSRILAFDYFVHNDDRHLRNYLVKGVRDNRWVMLAMDFSRSWSFHGFPPATLPFTAAQKTRYCHRFIKREIGDFLDLSEVSRVLETISSIKTAEIDNILDRQPPQWLTRARKDDILVWWKSASRPKRIADISRGIGDGSYL